jgi:hypothetical protein
MRIAVTLALLLAACTAPAPRPIDRVTADDPTCRWEPTDAGRCLVCDGVEIANDGGRAVVRMPLRCE